MQELLFDHLLKRKIKYVNKVIQLCDHLD